MFDSIHFGCIQTQREDSNWQIGTNVKLCSGLFKSTLGDAEGHESLRGLPTLVAYVHPFKSVQPLFGFNVILSKVCTHLQTMEVDTVGRLPLQAKQP